MSARNSSFIVRKILSWILDENGSFTQRRPRSFSLSLFPLIKFRAIYLFSGRGEVYEIEAALKTGIL